ncbi:AidA/PixA family protein [Xenorhabdus sp. PB62.4]|uniref:AidA/PixA family protein n=1 Tax=Xenorhabdus sp. PB62.4 TaxID=1851573 RepID=UPI0016570DDA|nr:AidA/PixA family protein [Xenorhabdus sp. PB62.4]MBC8954238.1 methionine-rich PixA inclusion body protein [Xenorhabdus sp. PB62.4]
MSDVIDILVDIDADSIMRDYHTISQDVDKPTYLPYPDNYIEMLTRSQDIELLLSSQLKVKLDLSDSIRWREVALTTTNLKYSSAISKCYRMGSSESHFFDMPDAKPVNFNYAKMVADNTTSTLYPIAVMPQEARSYYIELEVKRMPPAQSTPWEHYTFVVGIYRNGNLTGYISWNMAIVLDHR